MPFWPCHNIYPNKKGLFEKQTFVYGIRQTKETFFILKKKNMPICIIEHNWPPREQQECENSFFSQRAVGCIISMAGKRTQSTSCLVQLQNTPAWCRGWLKRPGETRYFRHAELLNSAIMHQYCMQKWITITQQGDRGGLGGTKE